MFVGKNGIGKVARGFAGQGGRSCLLHRRGFLHFIKPAPCEDDAASSPLASGDGADSGRQGAKWRIQPLLVSFRSRLGVL
jgi:hypothetical protein